MGDGLAVLVFGICIAVWVSIAYLIERLAKSKRLHGWWFLVGFLVPIPAAIAIWVQPKDPHIVSLPGWVNRA